MEKYSQFRDKGTGIAPFFPVTAEPYGAYLPFHIFLFVVRVPILLFFMLAYFLVFAWLPIGSFGKKAALWMILGTPGIWWVNLQVDGLKKGTLTRSTIRDRLPHTSSIIVASSTSPLDSLYLAAVFDPVFTTTYPDSRLLRRTSLLSSIFRAFRAPALHPLPLASGASASELTTLPALISRHPRRPILLLPESTTTNGRAILPLSPALLEAPANTKIFVVSLKYAPADVTTPVPGWREGLRFLWNLCSRPTHTIRFRVAEPMFNTLTAETNGVHGDDDGGENADAEVEGVDESDGRTTRQGDVMLRPEEKAMLDKVGEALARLGRVKRVAIGVREKIEFVKVWSKRR